jgi:hypothetical protein
MPPDKRVELTTDEDLEEAVSEALRECCEDDIDQMVVESLFIANLSLRKAEDLTGIPKTTIARRRDGLRVRLGNYLKQEPSVQKRLVTSPAHRKLYL